MKTLALVICLFGSAMCQHWGLPQQVGDTPEVAAATAVHLAALAKAHQQQPYSGPEDDGSYRPEHHQGNWDNDDSSYRADDHSWTAQAPHAPESQSWAHQPQQWAQPQAHHASQQHWDAPQKKWTGPIAHSPGFDKNGAPLQVLDTPEVAAAKTHHFNLYAHGAHAASAAHAAPTHQAAAYAPQGAPTYAQPAPVWKQ